MTPVLTHIALHVERFSECVRFYENYCGMRVCHHREDPGSQITWLSEPGRERELIIVVIDHGRDAGQAKDDFSHLGFAMESRGEVDAIARRAEQEGCLVWPPKEEPYPVGYYCGVHDPAGNCVEFSYGQPLGPGAPEVDT